MCTISSSLVQSGEIYLIVGMQKMTLLDYPEKVGCTVFGGMQSSLSLEPYRRDTFA